MKIRWNMKAFQQIRRMPGVKSRLKSEAGSMANSAGDGYTSESGEGKTRSRASVVTATREAVRDNSSNNTLSRILASRSK